MSLTRLDLLFWAAGFVGHLALLCIILSRHRAKDFPIFTSLITLNVIRTLVLFPILRHGARQAYVVSYWSLAIIDVALEWGVVYEVASRVFRPAGRWPPDFRRAAQSLVLIAIVIAGGLTWLSAPATISWKDNVVIRGSLLSSALMSEFFICMTALSVSSGLPWKTHSARIAQGLGAYSLMDVLIEAGHSYLGLGYKTPADLILSHLRMSVYLISVCYWAFGLWIGAPQPRELPFELRKQLSALQVRAALDLRRLRGEGP